MKARLVIWGTADREDHVLADLTIRLASSNEYLAFHELCNDDAPHPLTIEQRLQRRRAEFAQIAEEKRLALFAVLAGQVVGCVQLRFDEKRRGQARVHALVVARAHRRQGVATCLMDGLEQLAAERGLRELVLYVHADNEPAIRLYSGRGYQTVPACQRTDDETECLMLRKGLTGP